MLNIVSSNRLEALSAALCRQLQQSPPSSVFTAEVIVVPAAATGRWLNLQIASRLGIAMNFHYPLPSTFVWQLARQCLPDVPEQDPLSRDVVSWRVFHAIPQFLSRPSFSAMENYLQDDAYDIKRWQLANRIADAFDRYQQYRPHLLQQWSEAPGNNWQAQLWKYLLKGIRVHRLSVMRDLLEQMQNTSGQWPERIGLFAVPGLPAPLLQVFHGLSNLTEVDFYQLSPTNHYWADLVSSRQLAEKRLQRPEEAPLWEVGNALLSSWGRFAQSFQDRLLLLHPPPQQDDRYQEPEAKTTLGTVQNDIFNLHEPCRDKPGVTLPESHSVSFHNCHNALRECQVLHDMLLSLLARHSDWQAEDILVLVPDLEHYAPFIEAVFQKSKLSPFLAWNISDVTLPTQQSMVHGFLQLLQLPQSRLTFSELASLLEILQLRARFGFSEADLDRLRQWLYDYGFRWGLDGEHKRALGLPGEEANTLAQVVERLLLGYCMADEHLFAGIKAGRGISGHQADLLGRFWRFQERLASYYRLLNKAYPVSRWLRLLEQLVDDFFLESADEANAVQPVRDAIAELGLRAACHDEPVSIELIHLFLAGELRQASLPGRAYSGGVTFCKMHYSRCLPFRVICLLGMQDESFPRRHQALEFDVMAHNPQPGDPHHGREDRFAFLQALLQCREIFYISYVGRSVRDNSECQPSILVRELMDYIDRRFLLAEVGSDERTSARLTTRHPMQVFDSRQFTVPASSYKRFWCTIARQLLHGDSGSPAPQKWPGLVIEKPVTDRQVDLAQLHRFFAFPARYFAQQSLRIYLTELAEENNEEDFTLDGLQRFQLQQRLLISALQQKPLTLAELRAEAGLPHGVMAALNVCQLQADLQPFVDRMSEFDFDNYQPLAIDQDLHSRDHLWHLQGQVDAYCADAGLLRFRVAKLKGPQLLSLWIDYLVCCRQGGFAQDFRASLIAKDREFRISAPLSAEEATAHLSALMDVYRQGQGMPLMCFPECSFAYALARYQGQSREQALSKLDPLWRGNRYRNGIAGESTNAYVQLFCRQATSEILMDTRFTQLAEQLYLPLLGLGMFR